MSTRTGKSSKTAVDENGRVSRTSSFFCAGARASSRLGRAYSVTITHPTLQLLRSPTSATAVEPECHQDQTIKLSKLRHQRSQSATLNHTYRQSITGFHPGSLRAQLETSRPKTPNFEMNDRRQSSGRTFSQDSAIVPPSRKTSGILKHYDSFASSAAVTPRSSIDELNEQLRYTEGVSDADELQFSEGGAIRFAPDVDIKPPTLRKHHERKASMASLGTLRGHQDVDASATPDSNAFSFKMTRVTTNWEETPPVTPTTRRGRQHKSRDLSIDFLSAQLLPQLVPSIKIGKEVVVRSEHSPIRRPRSSFDDSDLGRKPMRNRNSSLPGLHRITPSMSKLRSFRSTRSLRGDGGEGRRKASSESRPASRQSDRFRMFNLPSAFAAVRREGDEADADDVDDRWIEILPDDENVTQNLATAQRLDELLEQALEETSRQPALSLPSNTADFLPEPRTSSQANLRGKSSHRSKRSRKSKRSARSYRSDLSQEILDDSASADGEYASSENSANEAEIKTASRRTSSIDESGQEVLMSRVQSFYDATSGEDEPTLRVSRSVSVMGARTVNIATTPFNDWTRFRDRKNSIVDSSESEAESGCSVPRMSKIPLRRKQDGGSTSATNRLSAVCEASFEYDNNQENIENVPLPGGFVAATRPSSSTGKIPVLAKPRSPSRTPKSSQRKQQAVVGNRSVQANITPSKLPRRKASKSSESSVSVAPPPPRPQRAQERPSLIPIAANMRN
ncbi:hypothetical protein BT69DRAFT_27358 [Atractiella rhizophila]|nr:hypothetical protein BT69DRAFT_27358 [Atractiella rhizophila]